MVCNLDSSMAPSTDEKNLIGFELLIPFHILCMLVGTKYDDLACINFLCLSY